MTDARRGGETDIPWFREIVGSDPYPWQRRLHGAFVGGDVPEAADIPTGLGKTLCVLLFLLARTRNPALPRRIVYVVDRRAIVDQTAGEIRAWIDRIAASPALADEFERCSAFPSDRPVRLGVLRGGQADDGEWRVDPARPAVVVGTVDMIGSRILFSGYGDGRARRPMHAGLLGHDSIVMLDEAHLSPAMKALLHDVERIQGHPKFRTMTLSATGADASATFSLSAKDEDDPAVRRRLRAVKTPRFHPVEKPADRIGEICERAAAHRTGSVAVFVRTVADAGKIAKKLIGKFGAERVALLTGTLRGKERAELAAGAVWRRFLPDRDRDAGTPSVYLVTTSAGEVGVDLDATGESSRAAPGPTRRADKRRRAAAGATPTWPRTPRRLPREAAPVGTTARSILRGSVCRCSAGSREKGREAPGVLRASPRGLCRTFGDVSSVPCPVSPPPSP